MNSSKSNSLTVIQLKGQNFTTDEDEPPERPVDQSVEYEVGANIMCIIFKYNKIGAAYYNFKDGVLYAYEETMDIAPQFLAVVGLYREVQPGYVLTFGNPVDDFIKVMMEIMTNRVDGTVSSNSAINLPENLILLPLKEYSYEVCRRIVCDLNLASNRCDFSEVKQELYINTLINFDYKLSVQAVGTVVKYLEKNWASFGLENKDDLVYMHLAQICRKNRLLIDNTTFRSLKVFSKRGHDASFKRGLRGSSREGLSIFKLFSAHCKCTAGLVTLKKLLSNPINESEILNNRLDFIGFCLDSSNRDFVESLQDNMKRLSHDLNNLLMKIANSRASRWDWYVLHKTIYHMLFINDISAPYRKHSPLLMELNDAITQDLIGLENAIENGLDFNVGQKKDRPSIRFGLDQNLDAKKLRQQDIAKDVTAAARFAANNLPDFLSECAVVYLPEMGHLIAITEWEENCNPEQLEYLGFHYMFTLKGRIHYKNSLCVEMDKRLGDINAEIIDHENRILRRLSTFILKHNKDIREPYKIIGMIDCLIAMAVAASQHSYTRPTLNETNLIEIEASRHPLSEHVVDQFQANDFYSGGSHSRMKIITGPNGSGKSMYLQQIALIVFLAHVGSYIPAKNTTIGMLNSMHSRIQTTESAAVRLSAFMLDIIQVSQALSRPTAASLILLDEFGRGTTDEDGIAILGGVLKKFLCNRDGCPHVIVSTHFQQINVHLPETSLIRYQKMEHTKEEGNLYFLFKIAEGMSNSYAFDVAESLGIDKDVLGRAKEIMECLRHNTVLTPLKKGNPRYQVSDDLLQINVPELDPEF